jgi:hypothetical protein
MSVTGGCLCGGVRYRYDGEAGPATYYCHCTDCRRATGGAFNIGVRFELARFAIERGLPSGFTKTGQNGAELTRHFCAACGSPLFTSSPTHPETIYIKAGTLDDPAVVAPEAQIWIQSAVSWARIPPGLASFEKGRV